MSHIARLREEYDAKEDEIRMREPRFMEQKKALNEKLASLQQEKCDLIKTLASIENQQHEALILKERLDALVALEPAIDAAMRTKSSSTDVLKHVIEHAIQSDHLSANEVVQTTLNTAMQLNGRTRSDNLDDLLIDLIDGTGSLRQAIRSAMERFADVDDVVQQTLVAAWTLGTSPMDLKKKVLKTVSDMLGACEDTESIQATTKTEG